MDGFTGFPDAVKAVFPNTCIQLCIIHMVRNSTRSVSYKDLKEVCSVLKKIYSAVAGDAGRQSLETSGEKWKMKQLPHKTARCFTTLSITL